MDASLFLVEDVVIIFFPEEGTDCENNVCHPCDCFVFRH